MTSMFEAASNFHFKAYQHFFQPMFYFITI